MIKHYLEWDTNERTERRDINEDVHTHDSYADLFDTIEEMCIMDGIDRRVVIEIARDK